VGDESKSVGKVDPAYVLSDRDYSQIVHLENPNVIERILSTTRAEATDYVGKLLQSGVPRYISAGPKVAFTAMAIEALTDLGREIADWIRAGRIPEDFSGRPAGYQTWVDLLQEIDSNPIDGERLKAMKAMFLAANDINATDGQSVLGYQLFQIAKTLTSGELLLLKAVFVASRNSEFSGSPGRVALEGWARTMAGKAGHGLYTLVIRDSNALELHGLINAKLDISAAPYAMGQNWVDPANARLTELGARFCENVRHYEAEAGPEGRS
jgi:hypothetical protein